MWAALRRPSAVVLFVVVRAAASGQERLPVRWFTVADGLPGDRVLSMLEDARGFLWIGTAGGLARYDGDRFVVYGVQDGLPGLDVESLAESRDGHLFVATAAGVARLRTTVKPGEPPFETVFAGERHGLTGGGTSRIFWGAADGVYAIDEGGSSAQRLPQPLLSPKDATVWDVHLDGQGALWLAYEDRLARRAADGGIAAWSLPGGALLRQANGWWTKFFEEPDGSLWLATPANGFWRLAAEPRTGSPVVGRIYTNADGLPYNQVRGMNADGHGTIWVATPEGLARLLDGRSTAGARFEGGHLLGASDGRCVNALLTDRAGNLWVGTDIEGLARVAAAGFVSTAFDGSSAHPNDLEINQVFEMSGGAVVAIGRDLVVHTRDGPSWTSFSPRCLIPPKDRGWGWGQIAAQDAGGDLWLVAGAGLLRWSRPSDATTISRRPPDRVFARGRGLGGVEAFRVFVDSHDDVWAGVFPAGPEAGLVRLDRRTDVFRTVAVDGLAPSDIPSAFAEDSAGDVWVGFYRGRVRRIRNGRATGWDERWPEGTGVIEAIARDHLGRLWIATMDRGVIRVDAPESDAPRFSALGRAQGLTTDQSRCVVEGPDERIYVGTTRGVDRVDVTTHLVQHFTAADGLQGNAVKTAYRDRAGQLWFGTVSGLSRFVPRAGAPPARPVAYLTSLRVNGEPRAPSPLPFRDAAGLAFGPEERNVEISFTSPDFRPGSALRFQTMLAGADADWRAPTSERTISYAHLAPGSYRFAVRALDVEHGVHGEPARVAFEVIAPFWKRGWFLLSIAAAIVAVAAILVHARVARLLEVERLRTRIASDLHDEIGSGLSRISILSEVARRGLAAEDGETGQRLASIAAGSGELVDSMSDIVWAVNPGRDRFGDLVHRMRRVAGDLMSGGEVELSFTAPAGEPDARLGDDVRRQVLLVYKEAMNNVVRHSGCSRVDVGVALDRDGLDLRIRDDGRGFDPGADSDGHGLTNMRARAAAIGATLEIATAKGLGTTVELRVANVRGRAPRPYANAQGGAGLLGRITKAWRRGRS
jgi:signal transduction histidine kinase/ligand-binding sensor domain-containing protein